MGKKEKSLRLVQFPHPGGEDKPIGTMKTWNNKKNHKRVFLKSRGYYLSDLSESRPVQSEITFWGEWEAEADLVKRTGQDSPKYIFEPYYKKPISYYNLQNTDPFVFGDQFKYVCCRQYIGNDPTKMRFLKVGSLILFGSSVGKKFVLDTVFVVKDSSDLSRETLPDLVASPEVFGLSKNYIDVTIAPLYPDYFSGTTTDVTKQRGCGPKNNMAGSDNETKESINTGGCAVTVIDKDCPTESTLSLYTGVHYDERDDYNGMFSFFPCLPYGQNPNGFKRPIIKIDDFISDRLAMNFKSKTISPADAKRFWKSVVDQVVEKGLFLGIHAQMPEMRK